MLLQTDVKYLEWVCAVYLSQDEIGIEELLTNKDIHEDNQRRFQLPTRLAAKTLLFRTIYGGSGYSFSIDPEFGHLGGEGWWDEKITSFYAKYQGLHAWHERIYERIILDGGKLTIPTGRIYTFQPYLNKEGVLNYPRTKILNYPVQGLAADIMSIARVSMYKRLRHLDTVKFVNTVHDSVILDIETEMWYTNSKIIVDIIRGVFEDIPKNFKKLFNSQLNVSIKAEISAGVDWKSLTEVQ